jgi:Transposase DDE domain
MQKSQLTDQAVAIYCFLDDFFQKIAQKQDSTYKVSQATVLSTAIIAARFFGGNHAAAMDYMRTHQGLTMLDKSAFNRRLHKLSPTLEALFYYLAEAFKKLNLESRYVIDSFPVEVCDNIRISRSKIVQGEDYRGKIASKRRYFYGFRVQLICTADGFPVQYFIHPGAFVDVTALQTMDIDLPTTSHLFGDSGYLDYEQEDHYAECEQIYLRIQRKSNSKRKDEPYQVFLKKHIRQEIERVFSRIKRRFPKKIHAVTEAGFILKIVLFLLAYAFEKVY